MYQSATLKAMETSSKTASCWALGPQRGTKDNVKTKSSTEVQHVAKIGNGRASDN